MTEGRIWSTVTVALAVLIALDGLRRGLGVTGVLELGVAAGLLLGTTVARTGRRPEDDGRSAVTNHGWRPPIIHGASGSLLQLLPADDLAARVAGEVELIVPGRLRMLARGMRRGHTLDDQGSTVLLTGRPATAALISEATAATAGVPLLRVRVDELVSDDPGFSQRAMSTIVRDAARHTPCVLFLDGLDRIARADTSVPAHQARRATNDVLSTLHWASTVPGMLVITSTAAVGALDRSVTVGRFDHTIAAGERLHGAGRPRQAPSAGAA